MKVKCVNNENGVLSITVGREYEIIKNFDFYRIVNDEGVRKDYRKERFKEVNDTMDNNKIQSEINELKEKIKYLEDELHKKVEEENKKKWWKPEIGYKYYWINDMDGIPSCNWADDTIDNVRYKIGNIFQTEKQAERESFERELKYKLKKFAYENNEEEIDWNYGEQSKYSIYYNYEDEELDWEENTVGRDFNQIHFTSKEIVKEAIETFKDDLIRYFTSDK